MLQKYLLAFVLGGLLVGGVVYVVSRPAAAPVPAAAPATATQPQAAPPAQSQPAPAQTNEQPAPAQTSQAPAPQRAARRSTPVQPPAAETPAPAPAPQVAQAAPVHQAPPEEPVQTPAPAPRHDPAPILRPDAAAETAKTRTPQTVTIPAGTVLAVRLRQLISTDRQVEGDSFAATLDQPIVIDGFVIADKGSNVRGRITSLVNPGRVKGRAALSLVLTEINTTDGQRVEVNTDTYHNEAASGAKGDAAKVGAGAALGAIIGAIAGGGKGAAIGAGVGGAAGGGAVLATKGQDVRLTAETRLSFRLAQPVTLTEKLN